MVAIGTGGGLLQGHVRRGFVPYGHRAVGSNGGAADIAAIVTDIGIPVFALEQHIAMCFSARNGVGDRFSIAAAVQISQVAPGIHLFPGKFAGIAVCIFDHTAFSIGLVDDVGIGTVFIQHGTGHVVRAKSHRVHTGGYGTVAESGGIFAQGFRTVAESGGTIVISYSFIAKGCGVLS